VSAIVAAAAGAEDPLLGALLLSELAGLPEPPGGMRAARRIAQKALPVHVLRGHLGPALGALFDPGGAHLVSGSFDGTVRVWRTDGTGDPTVLSGATAVTSLALHPDGKLLAVGTENAEVRLWRWGEPRPLATLGGHRAAVTQLASPGTRVRFARPPSMRQARASSPLPKMGRRASGSWAAALPASCAPTAPRSPLPLSAPTARAW
jgi:hypothetical protein